MHPVSAYVGERLRARRVALGLSQKDVGDRLGISYQQLQKYEAGANSLNVNRLLELSVLLGVPVVYFFGTIEGAEAKSDGQAMADEGSSLAARPPIVKSSRWPGRLEA